MVSIFISFDLFINFPFFFLRLKYLYYFCLFYFTDSNWNSDERIDILNKKIIEARRIYAEEQTKLAKFEKCLKKIKRKRREGKRREQKC